MDTAHATSEHGETNLSYTVKETVDKGRGLFAAKSFQRGDCIVHEAPLVAGIQKWSKVWAALIVVVAAFWQCVVLRFEVSGTSELGKIYWLMCGVWVIMLKFAIFKFCEVLNIWCCVCRLGKAHKDHYYTFSSKLPFYMPIISEFMIFRLNAVCDDASGSLCATVSLVNHDCLPNSCFYWNAKAVRQEVHAMRAINQGEEITTSYCDLWQTTSVRRKALVRDSQFECVCQLCTAPAQRKRASDTRRSLCKELERGIPIKVQQGLMQDTLSDLKCLHDTARDELGGSDNVIVEEMRKAVLEMECKSCSRSDHK